MRRRASQGIHISKNVIPTQVGIQMRFNDFYSSSFTMDVPLETLLKNEKTNE